MLKQNVFAHFRVTGCINKKCLYIVLQYYNYNIVRATSSSALVILITRLQFISRHTVCVCVCVWACFAQVKENHSSFYPTILGSYSMEDHIFQLSLINKLQYTYTHITTILGSYSIDTVAARDYKLAREMIVLNIVVVLCTVSHQCESRSLKGQSNEKMPIPKARFSHVHMDVVGPLPASRGACVAAWDNISPGDDCIVNLPKCTWN